MDSQQNGYVPPNNNAYNSDSYAHNANNYQQHGQYFGYGQIPHPMVMQGMNHRSNATVLGVIGLFVLGIVLGPLAISQANKAQSMGVPATAGKVLGWIGLIFGLLGLLWFFAALGAY
ncbi:hypothetical protein [uncultured Kocuria sp.]|uniref:hypothetical protein n=1 Tax=uncultured Kocuria sp. TaxID=259305 RepID=UPI0026189596|nr:hypothetical protein [uncultured Kocuria sp.]